ncbi:MAG TPA: hypothetical protein VE057_28535 [Archangium sp.]|nr:hypothetical protein [Archangium sp.]
MMFRIRMAVALACCGLVVGCSSTEQRFCDRADECNILPAGMSADECADRTTQCTEDLTSSDRADWYNVMGDCLELQSCTNFVNCYGNVPNC